MNTYSVSLINTPQGGVEGHRGGCADVPRKARLYRDDAWTFEVKDLHEAWVAYNSDFLAECYEHESCDEEHGECVNAYTIDWKPCADGIPAYADDEKRSE